jgi:dihydrodipicolinate synthase/N-acetylneuraminate lyase
VTVYGHTVSVLQEVKAGMPDFTVLSGWEDLIFPSLVAGADGPICAFANVAPELFVNLVKSTREGDLETAARLHRRVLELVTLGAHSDPPIGAIKLATRILGVPISPTMRGPALPADQGAREEIATILENAGGLNSSKARFGGSRKG